MITMLYVCGMLRIMRGAVCFLQVSSEGAARHLMIISIEKDVLS